MAKQERWKEELTNLAKHYTNVSEENLAIDKEHAKAALHKAAAVRLVLKTTKNLKYLIDNINKLDKETAEEIFRHFKKENVSFFSK